MTTPKLDQVEPTLVDLATTSELVGCPCRPGRPNCST